MKVPATLTLNGAVVPVELDVPDDLFAPAPAPIFLDDPGLRERWGGCSARTTYRVREARRIPYTNPTKGRYLYRLEDVEAFEAAQRTEARPIVRVARRTA